MTLASGWVVLRPPSRFRTGISEPVQLGELCHRSVTLRFEPACAEAGFSRKGTALTVTSVQRREQAVERTTKPLR